MRLDGEIEKDGYWWLPTRPDTKVPGKLRCDQTGRPSLEVVGTLSGMPIEIVRAEIPVILGFTVDGELVTILDSYMSSSSMRAPGISTARYEGSALLVGIHISAPDVEFFRTVRFSLDGLDQWLARSGFDLQVDDGAIGFTLRYELPENIYCNLDADTKIGVEFSWVSVPVSKGFLTTGYSISQSSVLRVDFSQEVTLRTAQEFIFRLSNLLCFAASATLNLRSCNLSGPLITKKLPNVEVPTKVSLYYASLPEDQREPSLRPDGFLFKFQGIRPFFEKFIQNYFQVYRRIGDVLDLYFAVTTHRGAFWEQNFLGIVQALEALHRRTSENQALPEQQHQARIEAISQSVPEEYRDWLMSRLAFSNEPPLRVRLKELAAPVKTIFWKNGKARSRFIDKVVDLRNYLTHYSHDRREKATIKPETMVELLELLRALFEINMLQLLGFDEDDVRAVIDNNNRLQQLKER